jgi:FMN phosphatase YigB (HAD superfamily)
VLFDVDGTLYHQPLMRAFMAAELACSALHPRGTRTASRVVRALGAYRRAQESLRARGVVDTRLEQLQIAEAAAAARCSEAEVRESVAEWMVRRPLKYLPLCRRPGLAVTLTGLRRRGVRLGVLSDYPAVDKLAALGVANVFSLALCATDREIGAFKPSPRGFWRACEQWNLSPNEVLYVGDRSDVDGQGAHAAGLRCVIITADWRQRPGSLHVVRRFAEIGGLVSA